MNLEIKFNNGSMVIHLEVFLGCRSITKVKKLVKVIQHSYTPETLDLMKEFIERGVEQFEPRMREDKIYISGYETKLKFAQEKMDVYRFHRDCCKKNTEHWKKYNEVVKQYRQEVSEIKAALKSKKSDFDDCIRNKAFYERVLEIIS